MRNIYSNYQETLAIFVLRDYDPRTITLFTLIFISLQPQLIPLTTFLSILVHFINTIIPSVRMN